MVAPASHNQAEAIGTFGEPIRRSIGSTWTEREFRALKAKARYGSVSRVIRGLIPPETLIELIRVAESGKSRFHDTLSNPKTGEGN